MRGTFDLLLDAHHLQLPTVLALLCRADAQTVAQLSRRIDTRRPERWRRE